MMVETNFPIHELKIDIDKMMVMEELIKVLSYVHKN